ncbi:MAG: His/Gly/Thr/Pro-type tRNA ligase C-terminal domain-containing protein, partial [Planctomycetota bacterium]
LRCEADLTDEKINAKIAKAHAEKLPYMLVVGPKESQSNTVNVRTRGRKDTVTLEIDKFIPIASCKIADRKIDLDLEIAE